MIAAVRSSDPRGEALDFVAAALSASRPVNRSDPWVRVTIPAPIANPLSLPNLSLFWSTPSEVVSGAGTAHSIRTEGHQRFARVRSAAQEFWTRLVHCCHPNAATPAPRLFGGFSFSSGVRSDEWSEFGDGQFFVPRLFYCPDAAAPSLTVCARPSERMTVLPALATALDALARDAHRVCQPPQVERVDTRSPAAWRVTVESLRDAIRAGNVQKVVAARRTLVHLQEPVDLPTVLGRLWAHRADGTCFAFAPGSSAFFGASPETLVTQSGNRVTTVALAGSVASSIARAQDILLASRKDRSEQGIVVTSIANTLERFCDSVSFPPQPQVQVLRDVLHLQTPITGRLRQPQHILELVEALHPTPAVGGAPQERALELIANEPDERGWYAAPVGWFDGEGNGEFSVAIRSALLRNATAFVYAGAGIVADSDPDAEYIETALKQQAVMKALGASD